MCLCYHVNINWIISNSQFVMLRQNEEDNEHKREKESLSEIVIETTTYRNRCRKELKRTIEIILYPISLTIPLNANKSPNKNPFIS